MAESWTIWPNYNSGAGGSDGDGPRIGIVASTSTSSSSVTISYAFYLQGRNNYPAYGISSSWSTSWSGYVPNIGNVSGGTNGVWRGSYTDTLKSGSISVARTDSNQSVSFSLSINSWGGVRWNSSTGGATSISLSVNIPAIKRLGTPTISTSYGTILPSKQTFDISWNAISNASSYGLYIKDSSGITHLNEVNVSSTTYKATLSNLENYRGRNLIAYVYAKGSGDYSSSSITNKVIATINQLPSAPSISASGDTINGGQGITFSATPGSSSDKLYYSLITNEKKEFTNPLEINIYNAASFGINNPGTYNIHFYAYDGLEYSNYSQNSSKSFTITFAPTFTTQDEEYILVKDGFGNQNLVSQAILKFTLQVNSTSGLIPRVFLKTGKEEALVDGAQEIELASAHYTFNISQVIKTIGIDIGKLSEELIPRGHYFKFSYTISDSYSESKRSNWTTIKQRPQIYQKEDFPAILIINDSSNTIPSLDNWFKEKVTFNFTNPQARTGYPDISKLEVQTISNDTQTFYSIDANEGVEQNFTLTLDSVLGGKDVEIYLRLIDVAGQITTSNLLATLHKTAGIIFANSEISLSAKEIAPLSNKDDFKIAHSPAQAGGTLQENIIFTYRISNKNKEVIINKEKIKIEQLPDLITLTLSPEYIKELANEVIEFKNNVKEIATITIIATDGFNNTKQILTNFTLNFTEPPILPNLDFYLRHDYQINNIKAPDNFGIEVPTFLKSDKDTFALDIRMFNAREGIIFSLPIATDENEDISNYEISISRNIFTEIENVIIDENLLTFSTWLSISKEELDNCPKDGNYYYYRYSVSEYTYNQYFYFKLRVKDTQGNYSKEKISNTFIIGCRTVAPKFSVGSISVERKPSGELGKDNIYLKYNLQITDLGGSATDTWDEDYYNDYKNFERNFTDVSGQKYNPKIYLLVQASPTQSFREIYPEVPEYIAGSSPLLDFKQTETLIKDFPSSESKIYMKFILVVSYGLDSSKEDGLAIVSSTPQIFSYFGAVPTVSHRSHKVGINTTGFEGDDVFVVENYQGNRYIIFRGTDPINAAKTYQIKIDLLTSTIDGAIIDCGSWDKI